MELNTIDICTATAQQPQSSNNHEHTVDLHTQRHCTVPPATCLTAMDNRAAPAYMLGLSECRDRAMAEEEWKESNSCSIQHYLIGVHPSHCIDISD